MAFCVLKGLPESSPKGDFIFFMQFRVSTGLRPAGLVSSQARGPEKPIPPSPTWGSCFSFRIYIYIYIYICKSGFLVGKRKKNGGAKPR